MISTMQTTLTDRQAKTLRAYINQLARELEQAATKAEARNLKLAIRAAEFALAEG